ncbi:hypothetical protein [Marinobacter alexandrii]|jgi:hypothetical protein|nr:hypothetical protein [Marinobacter alexandrii]
MNNQRVKQAETFRNERGYHGGHVIFLNDEIVGWTRCLDAGVHRRG